MFPREPFVCFIALSDFKENAPRLCLLWYVCLLQQTGTAVSELVNASVLWQGQG